MVAETQPHQSIDPLSDGKPNHEAIDMSDSPDEASSGDVELKMEKAADISTVGDSAPVPFPPQNNPNQIKGVKLALVFLGLTLGIFLAALDQSIIATALPKIASDFGQFVLLPWVATAYLLTNTAFQPLYGRLSDIFGRKPMFLFAITVFEIGSLICGLSTSMVMLIIFRAFQGIGAGGIIALVMIIISDVVPLRERGKYQGIIGATFGLASVVGPLLGGAFTDKVTWQWCFFINLPFGAVAVLTVVFFLKLQKPTGNMHEKLKRIDYFGIITLIPAVVTLLLATNWGGSTYAWDSGIVIGLYCASGVLIIAFVTIEMKVAHEPLVNFRLFRIRNVTLCFLSAFFTAFCMLSSIIYIPVYFEVVRGYSATSAGLRLLPLLIAMVFCSIGSGILISKTGYIKPFPIIGNAVLALGMGMLSLLEVDSSFGTMIGLLIPTGFGLGLTLQSYLLMVQNSVERKEMASTTAGINFFRSIGFVIGVAVFGSIVNNQTTSKITPEILAQIPPTQIAAYTAGVYMTALKLAFQTGIAFAGIALILSSFLLNKRIAGTAPPSDGAAAAAH